MNCENSSAPLPDWAIGTTDGRYVLGAHLPTRDGRAIGNAHIVGIATKDPFADPPRAPYYWEVLTDGGTNLLLTDGELDELFHPPAYISDVAEVRTRFARR